MIESVTDEERLDRRQWVEPELSDARVDAGFQGLLAKEAKSKTSARAALVSAAAVTAAAAVALFAILTGDDGASPFVGTELTTHAEPTTVALSDGSTIEAQPHTSLSLVTGEEDEMAFALSRGAATFEVAPNPAREFLVEAGDVVVRVVGTRFSVIRETTETDRSIEVTVERGIVEVRAGEETHRLTAGERWERTDSVGPTPPVEQADVDEVTEDVERRRRGRATRAERVTAESLFDEARVARAEGRHADAAAAYERLLANHRRDRRAALAALELGRLRMDRLGDPAGAAQAFTTALRLAPRSPLREDTMARLVRAHEASGATGACRRAKERYLDRYAEGRHAADIAGRCD